MRNKSVSLPLLCLAAALLAAACGPADYTPKPAAYLRIDLPQAAYVACDTAALPFTFERNAETVVELKKNTRREVWADVEYPLRNGVVFLTYKRLHGPDDLRGQTDTSLRLIDNHLQFSSGIDEQTFSNAAARVHATTYRLKGRGVASTFQFWATDSVSHFLRGSLYINQTPNNDSLAPVIEYMQADINRLISTLRWKNTP